MKEVTKKYNNGILRIRAWSVRCFKEVQVGQKFKKEMDRLKLHTGTLEMSEVTQDDENDLVKKWQGN